MFLGKVIGSVWSTKKQPQIKGLKFLLVMPIHYKGVSIPTPGPEETIQTFFEKNFSLTIAAKTADKMRAIFSEGLYQHVRKELEKLLVKNNITLKEKELDKIYAFLSNSGEGVVVADKLDAGVGDTVVVAFGKAARVAIDDTNMPIEAAVVAIVDEINIV